MKILLITSFFPSYDAPENDNIGLKKSQFLYYYAAEWVKLGCEVLLMHCPPKYPIIFSKMAYIIEKQMQLDKLNLCNYYQNQSTIQAHVYNYNGIKIIRIPISKYLPHREFFPFSIEELKSKTLQIIDNENFNADFTISDFLTPSSYLAQEIKKKMDIPFYQILHLTDFNYLKKYKKLRNMIRQADGILHRSTQLAVEFKRRGLKANFEDYIFSGVPELESHDCVRTNIKKILYVGALTPWKNVDVILKALSVTKNRSNYSLDIVGDGPYESFLKMMATELGLAEQVRFHGRVKRSEVFKKMRKADCFVMVSKGETFGMVYIEALSQGCIVIASKNKYGENFIKNGQNGFVTDCDDVNELAQLFDYLSTLKKENIIQLSKNAMKTTSNMTESNLAKTLLNKLAKHSKQVKQVCYS